MPFTRNELNLLKKIILIFYVIFPTLSMIFFQLVQHYRSTKGLVSFYWTFSRRQTNQKFLI